MGISAERSTQCVGRPRLMIRYAPGGPRLPKGKSILLIGHRPIVRDTRWEGELVKWETGWATNAVRLVER